MSQLLVTGTSGHLGGRVRSLLQEQGHQVIAGSRNPGPGGRRVDFDDPDLAAAFAGVDRLLLVSADDLSTPLRRLNQHRRAIAAAVEAGVKHVVYTSYIDPSPDSPVGLAVDHLGTEAALAESPLSFTILRNGLYTDNLLGSVPQVRASGQLFHATGGGANAWVTREDCARAAAAALVADDWTRSVVDVTGPDAITSEQLAGILQELVGRPVQAVDLPPDALRAGLLSAGLPDFVADMLVGFDVATARGRHARVSDGVERLTGRAPEAPAAFLARSLAAT